MQLQDFHHVLQLSPFVALECRIKREMVMEYKNGIPERV